MAAKKHEHHSEFDIIEASYRLVADASAFDDVIKSWMTRIDEVDDRQIAMLDQPLIVRHLKAVTKLFEQIQPEYDDRIERVVGELGGPAMVLSLDGTVKAANRGALDRWGIRVGEAAGTAWIDGHSLESFNVVQRSANRRDKRSHAILRTVDEGAISQLAECFIIDSYDERPGLLAIRALDLRWSAEVDAVLASAFNLTNAELAICRLLLDTRDTSQIADLRGSSVHTVRTQLRTIFGKTETSTQVDLIRMVALLCARAPEYSSLTSTGWIDPLGNEEIFHDGEGRAIAFSWTGDPDGIPALLCHGMATGYLLPNAGVDELRDRKIKLYAISRPGFGNSDPASGDQPMQSAADAIVALAGHLCIESWVAIGLSAGFPPLVRAAQNSASRLSSLVGAAAYLPYTRAETFQSFPAARKIAFRLARNSQLMADLVGRFCYRMAISKKASFLEDYMYSDCDADRETLRVSECAAMIALAGKFMITHQYRAIAGDLRIMGADWSKDLQDCPIPILLLHGEEDPVNRLSEVERAVEKHINIELASFKNSGELLHYSHSKEIVAALARASGS